MTDIDTEDLFEWDDPNRLMTIGQLNREYGIGVIRLRKLVKCGELPGYRVGAWTRVRRSTFEIWLEDQAIEASDSASEDDT